MTEARKLCRGLYAATDKVLRPVHVRNAPSPRGALAYSSKHVGDVKARAIFNGQEDAGGNGKRPRWLKAEERAIIERWARQQSLDDHLLLKGLRRFGGTVRRV